MWLPILNQRPFADVHFTGFDVSFLEHWWRLESSRSTDAPAGRICLVWVQSVGRWWRRAFRMKCATIRVFVGDCGPSIHKKTHPFLQFLVQIMTIDVPFAQLHCFFVSMHYDALGDGHFHVNAQETLFDPLRRRSLPDLPRITFIILDPSIDLGLVNSWQYGAVFSSMSIAHQSRSEELTSMHWFWESRFLCGRECILSREQDSSVGGETGNNWLGVVHMEGGVQVRVQVEVGRKEQGEGETHGKGQSEETTRNNRSTAHQGWPWVWGDALVQTLEPMWCDTHHSACALCRRKMTLGSVSVYSSRRLQWIAIDCKRNQL